MSTRSSRRLLIALPIAASLIACGPTTDGTPTAASPSRSTVTESPASSEGPPAPVSSPAPAAGQTDTDWGRVGAGNEHGCASKTNRTIYCWGDNAYGQLGQGDTLTETTPKLVPGRIGIVYPGGQGAYTVFAIN